MREAWCSSRPGSERPARRSPDPPPRQQIQRRADKGPDRAREMAAAAVSGAKRSLRAELKQRLRAVSAEERLRQSRLLTQKVGDREDGAHSARTRQHQASVSAQAQASVARTSARRAHVPQTRAKSFECAHVPLWASGCSWAPARGVDRGVGSYGALEGEDGNG